MLDVQLSAANPAETGTSLLAIALMENPSLAGIAAIDTASSGALARTFEMKDFRGTRDEMLHLTGIAKGPRRLLLVGMGAVTDASPLSSARARSRRVRR
jgi:Cytosol aminopeptidase family, N-terminal domain.